MTIREPTHAGTWYSADKTTLESQLDSFLGSAEVSISKNQRAKAIIAPHAGYRFSGATAAWSYKTIDPTDIKTIILMGPSHHVHLENRCALPPNNFTHYSTPLGPIELDTEILGDLRNQRDSVFLEFSIKSDEAEHSLEMHLPWIQHIMKNNDWKLVPIFVGTMSKEIEEYYASLLHPLFKKKDTLFIISSDFCHWGQRFRYCYILPECADMPLNDAIKALDMKMLEVIGKHDHDGFLRRLQSTSNTVCGRHPIGILLALVNVNPTKLTTELLHYSQSSKVQKTADSCVSYASCVTWSIG
eukprot:GHVL01013525.1.p1 GENE.GHVL01013525.1~~GHVL01013525.1.p1  ORF type:complete len:300 (+),score=32.13 GHVL01013525.1:32-931(+)